MDNIVAPIAALRLRLTEAAYRAITGMLPAEDRSPVFLVGLCGSTRIRGVRGDEVVACVHTLFNRVERISLAASEELVEWILSHRGKQMMWPILFHHRQNGEDELAGLCQRLSALGLGPIIDIEVSQDGSMSGRFSLEGEQYPVDTILIPGSDIRFWTLDSEPTESPDNEQTKRFDQSFGKKTQRIMSRLKIGVVGVSGTGSPVAEMLYRLGVGELVLVDDDRVEIKNLGRIYNSSMRDAQEGRYKVDVVGDVFVANGLPTQVRKIAATIFDPVVVRELAQCDVIFGCMDSESGRALLNRLCTFYLVPYFDLGVNLKADGLGSVSVICGAVHYLKPDGSSLLSRRAISPANIEAEDLKRTNPELYKQQKEEKYIKGVVEERPAVITVNTLVASLATNDLLARIHPYRHNPNSSIGCIRIDLREPEIHLEDDGERDQELNRWAGFGDMKPLLRRIALAQVDV
jgi:hypothetical protein